MRFDSSVYFLNVLITGVYGIALPSLFALSYKVFINVSETSGLTPSWIATIPSLLDIVFNPFLTEINLLLPPFTYFTFSSFKIFDI